MPSPHPPQSIPSPSTPPPSSLLRPEENSIAARPPKSRVLQSSTQIPLIKIKKEASSFGICKIVPPLPVPPKKTTVADLKLLRRTLESSLSACPTTLETLPRLVTQPPSEMAHGDRIPGVSVTKPMTWWSEQFQFTAAARLEASTLELPSISDSPATFHRPGHHHHQQPLPDPGSTISSDLGTHTSIGHPKTPSTQIQPPPSPDIMDVPTPTSCTSHHFWISPAASLRAVPSRDVSPSRSQSDSDNDIRISSFHRT